MAYRLYGTKPLPDPMTAYYQLDPKGQTWGQIVSVRRDVSPFRPLFSTQVHPLAGSSNVKHTPVGYQFFRFEPLSLGNICEIFKFNNLFGVCL